MLLRLKVNTATGANHTIEFSIYRILELGCNNKFLSFITKDNLSNISKDLKLINKSIDIYHYEFPMKRVNRIILLPEEKDRKHY